MQPSKKTAALAAVAIVAVGVIGAHSATARDFQFNVTPTYVWDGKPKMFQTERIDVGDANNDGRDDLSTIVWGPPDQPVPPDRHAQVRLQGADGALGEAIILALPMQFLNTIEAADLDHDGQNELVVGYDGGLLVYRWNGSEFVPTATTASFDCRHMAIADIDGNGTRDVFCDSAELQVASLYLVDPDGTVRAPTYMQTTTAGGYTRQFKLDDVTGDGRPDLLQTDAGVWSFMLYPNDGQGGFLPPRAYAYPLDYYTGMSANGIETFDVDADGTSEILVSRSCNTPCAALMVYRRDSAGYFSLWQSITTLDSPVMLDKYDVDGDGYLDLLVSHNGWDAVTRFMGTANGMSRNEIRTGLRTGLGYKDFGDLNGDGRVDMAITDFSYNATLSYGMGKRSRDVTGNFQSDLVWRDAVNGRNTIWVDSYVQNVRALPNVAAPWAVKAIADFNGDDKADLLWRNPSNGANMIWLGADANTLQDIAPLDAQWQVAGSGDFDGDGNDDIVWRHATSGENMLWLGAHHDQALTIHSVSDVRWQVVGVGDFDGDHIDDLLWRHMAAGQNAVWFSASADTSVMIAPVPSLAWKVVGIGDFNRDGMDDVVWRNTTSGTNSLWRSANAARQQPIANVGNPAWQIVGVGDYDGDGMDDLVWRNSNGSNLIWQNADASKQRTLGVAGTAWQVVP